MSRKISLVVLAFVLSAFSNWQGQAFATVVGDVSPSELAGYTQIYQLDIAASPNFSASVPYSVDNSGTVFTDGISRIGYYMELELTQGPREFVWVSVDAFTQDLTQIGVPGQSEGIIHQQILSNMNIESNDAAIVTGTGIATGNIEFWPHNYSGANGAGIPGATGAFDFGDTRSTGGNHGSMQIHNHGASQTLFALNRFNRGQEAELGIGPNTGPGSPDWTFNQTGNDYSLRNFEVWVLPATVIPEPTTATLGLIGLAGLMVRRRRAA